MSSPIQVSAEVAEAVRTGRPVVALESTIFTHGLPRPMNLDTALEGEQLVRDAGGVPATIGVFEGVPTVGLSHEQITLLSQRDDAIKAGIRELALAAVTGRSAGTTIAATSFLARAAGIDVFSTGGLGGVHHGASDTFDESSDLVAMASTSIVLVSSGAKAILDIGKTLERFETLSVPVVGYRTLAYPGFYVPDSGYRLSAQVDSPEQVARLLQVHRGLGATSGVLVANPIPVDEQLDPAELDDVVRRAWDAAARDGIHGQATTPYLLAFIHRETEGRSLTANVALYRNNIRLGVEVAKALVASR